MNINADDFEELRERITEFRRSIVLTVNESTKSDRTYQLNIQLFPLTEIKGGAL
jgi:uncharacterized protein (TIGR02147 family)